MRCSLIIELSSLSATMIANVPIHPPAATRILSYKKEKEMKSVNYKDITTQAQSVRSTLL